VRKKIGWEKWLSCEIHSFGNDKQPVLGFKINFLGVSKKIYGSLSPTKKNIFEIAYFLIRKEV
jgi:hypothetical protein